jgi:hypothetical protein
MKSRLKWSLALTLAVTITLAVRAQDIRHNQIQTINVEPVNVQPITVTGRDQQTAMVGTSGGAGPLNLIGAIPIQGLPLASSDLLWTDQASGRVFLADRTNKSVDVFDGINLVPIAQIPGFLGTPGVNGQGPNGLLVTPDNILWVGDGNSTLQAVDLNVYPWKITRSISVGGPADGRADEMAYDPVERLIIVGNDASVPPHLTIVSADTYQVVATIKLPDASGLEQPVWDQQLHRFLVNVPSSPGYVAVIDPRSKTLVKKHFISDCFAGVNGLVIGPAQVLMVSQCGRLYIMNAIDGRILNRITQVAGGDEIWFNPGDGLAFSTAADPSGAAVLGAIDLSSYQWVQNVPANGTRNVTAFAGNNNIFAAVRAPAAGTRDTTVCAQFGTPGTGCIAVFGHL